MSKMTLQSFDNGVLTLNTVEPSMGCEIATFNISEDPVRFESPNEYRRHVARRIADRIGLGDNDVPNILDELGEYLPTVCHFSGVTGCLDAIVVMVDAVEVELSEDRNYSVLRFWKTPAQPLSLSRDAQNVSADEAFATVFHGIG